MNCKQKEKLCMHVPVHVGIHVSASVLPAEQPYLLQAQLAALKLCQQFTCACLCRCTRCLQFSYTCLSCAELDTMLLTQLLHLLREAAITALQRLNLALQVSHTAPELHAAVLLCLQKVTCARHTHIRKIYVKELNAMK